MKKLVISIFAFFLLFSASYASDKNLTTKSYTSSNGSTTTVISNGEAQAENKFIENFKQSGIYKNYNKLSPNNTKTIKRDLPTPNSIRYSMFSNGMGNGRILDPIYIVLRDGTEMDIAPIIMAEAQKNNVDPLLIKTIIKYESGFCPFAVSPVGASGLMQLMPDTARALGISDVFSPEQNIAAGTLYIRRQLDAFNNNVAFALAAYNAGPGAVQAYGGLPPYAETINYVNMIIADYRRAGGTSPTTKPTVKKEKVEKREKRHVDVYSALDKMKELTSPSNSDEEE